MRDDESTYLVELILSLISRLKLAQETSNKEVLDALSITFGELLEASYVLNHKGLSSIIEDLECITRDSITGVPWKGKVPDRDEITSILKDKQF